VIHRLRSVSLRSLVSLGEAGQRAGRSPLEPKTYLLAASPENTRPEWEGVSLYYDTAERLLYVRVEGARAPVVVLPAEMIEKMIPADPWAPGPGPGPGRDQPRPKAAGLAKVPE
jgi:hypothetical protein